MTEDLYSDEQRRKLSARRQNPRGSHLKDEVGLGPEDMIGGETSDFAERLMRLEMSKNSEQAVLPMPKPRFDSTINTGHLLTIFTIIIGFITMAFGAYGVYKDQQTMLNDRFNSIQTSIMRMQDQMEDDRKQITRNKEEGDLRARHWIEVIEALAKSNGQQDSRLENMGKLLTDTIMTVSDLGKTTASIDKDFAVLRAQMVARGLPDPKGR